MVLGGDWSKVVIVRVHKGWSNKRMGGSISDMAG